MDSIIETLGSFLLVVLGSSTAIGLLNWYTDKSKRKSEIKYLATRIAVDLEGYAIDCAEQCSNHISHEKHNGLCGKLISQIPIIPAIGDTERYDFLDNALLDQILRLPQQLMLYEREIKSMSDVLDMGYVQDECCNKTLKIGLQALELSKEVRSKYHLPKRELKSGEWDIDKFYKEQIEKFNKPSKLHTDKIEVDSTDKDLN